MGSEIAAQIVYNFLTKLLTLMKDRKMEVFFKFQGRKERIDLLIKTKLTHMTGLK